MLLKFAPLLLITVSAVDNGGDQYPPKKTEEEQNPIPGSRVTSRLDVYKSLAKLDLQPRENFQPSIRSDQCILAPEDGETVNESLQHSLVEVREIIDVPTKHVIPTESIESLIVFQSLLKMLPMRYTEQSGSPLLWQEYLSESIKNLKCSVLDFCHEFGSHFKCDDEGHLIALILYGMAGRFDHFDLLMIPNTVKMIEMKRTTLKTISEWSDLKGKSLKTLRIHENGVSNLKLNLDGLQGTLDYLPLEHLTVGRCEISDYFGLQTVSLLDPALSRIGEWMSSSTLISLRIETKRNHKRKLYFQRYGSSLLIRVSNIGTAGSTADDKEANQLKLQFRAD